MNASDLRSKRARVFQCPDWSSKLRGLTLMPQPFQQSFLDRIRAGDTLLGGFVFSTDPNITEIYAAAGGDRRRSLHLRFIRGRGGM
jgi:hypothetical protein